MTPEKFAEELVKRQGPSKAKTMLEYYSQPMIGEDNSTVNPHAGFYLKAKNFAINRNLIQQELI